MDAPTRETGGGKSVHSDSARVLLVDDVPEIRDGLASLLESVPGIEVAGRASDGLDAVRAAAALEPDVVLMDLRMPGVDGIEATRRITSRHPKVAVLVHSAYGDESLVVEALLAGARGYLLKEAPPEQVIESVFAAARGEGRLSGEVTRPLLERMIQSLRREREALNATEDARRALEELHRRQLEFSTMAAHELRTPITGVLGALLTIQRLKDVDGADEQRETMLGTALRQARRLERLCLDLTAVDEASHGALSVHSGPVEVGPAVREAVGDLGEAAQQRVTVDVPPRLIAWADPRRVEQVLVNLIRNALQYSPPDSPVHVEAFARPDGGVEVAVVDRGPGIDLDRLPSIFERFRNGDRPAAEGLGVGLWIVRELMSALRGDVTVANNPEGGATFRITVPGPDAE